MQPESAAGGTPSRPGTAGGAAPPPHAAQPAGGAGGAGSAGAASPGEGCGRVPCEPQGGRGSGGGSGGAGGGNGATAKLQAAKPPLELEAPSNPFLGQEVTLRIQVVTKGQARALTWSVWVLMGAFLLMTAGELAVRSAYGVGESGEAVVYDLRAYFWVQLALGAACLVLVLLTAAAFAHAVWTAHRQGRVWPVRKRAFSAYAAALLAFELLHASIFVAAYARALGAPGCAFPLDLAAALAYLRYVLASTEARRSTARHVAYMLSFAYGLGVWRGPGALDAHPDLRLRMDRPARDRLPLFAAVGAILATVYALGAAALASRVPCLPDGTRIASAAALTAGLAAFVGLWWWWLRAARADHARLPYNRYRWSLAFVSVQQLVLTPVVVCEFLSVLVLELIGISSAACWADVDAQLGNLPELLCFTVAAFALAILYMPRSTLLDPPELQLVCGSEGVAQAALALGPGGAAALAAGAPAWAAEALAPHRRVVFIDTSGVPLRESSAGRDSASNPGEAAAAVALLAAAAGPGGVAPERLGVISPYNSQERGELEAAEAAASAAPPSGAGAGPGAAPAPAPSARRGRRLAAALAAAAAGEGGEGGRRGSGARAAAAAAADAADAGAGGKEAPGRSGAQSGGNRSREGSRARASAAGGGPGGGQAAGAAGGLGGGTSVDLDALHAASSYALAMDGQQRQRQQQAEQSQQQQQQLLLPEQPPPLAPQRPSGGVGASSPPGGVTAASVAGGAAQWSVEPPPSVAQGASVSKRPSRPQRRRRPPEPPIPPLSELVNPERALPLFALEHHGTIYDVGTDTWTRLGWSAAGDVVLAFRRAARDVLAARRRSRDATIGKLFVPSKRLPGGEAGVRALSASLDVGAALVLRHCDVASLADAAGPPPAPADRRLLRPLAAVAWATRGTTSAPARAAVRPSCADGSCLDGLGAGGCTDGCACCGAALLACCGGPNGSGWPRHGAREGQEAEADGEASETWQLSP
eukprot:scaffold23.g4119.t1